MSLCLTILAALLLVPAARTARTQGIPPEPPKHFQAIAPHYSFSAAKTVTVAVTSRRPENPAAPEYMERLRTRALDIILKVPFSAVSDKASADLRLELIVEPNFRYGMFRYQNAPYVYLLIREPSGGHLVYCAYRRASHFYSVSERLLHDLEHEIKRPGKTPTGSLAACAEQAMRPL